MAMRYLHVSTGLEESIIFLEFFSLVLKWHKTGRGFILLDLLLTPLAFQE